MLFKTISLAVSSQRFTLTPSASCHWASGDILLHQSGVSCCRFTLGPAVVITDLQATLYCISLFVSCRRFTLAPAVVITGDLPSNGHLSKIPLTPAVVFTGLQVLFKTISGQLSEIHLTPSARCHWASGNILLHQSMVAADADSP